MAAYTAETEWFGDSLDATITTNYRLRPPSGLPGCCRFYVLRPTNPSLDATLPDARRCQIASKLVVANHGTQTLTIKDAAGGTVTTVAVGRACELLVLANATAAGSWIALDTASTLGTSLVHDRVPVDIVISESIATGINLREWAFDLGFRSDAYPYAVRCTIRRGITVGRTDSTAEAFYTGTWPTNSTLLLTLEPFSCISGRGGAGGRGGDVSGLLAQPGGAGGHGLGISVTTALINHGTIQGGGGGGGGGVRSGTLPGAGGGGGAGYYPGAGGAPGNGAQGAPSAGFGKGAGIFSPGWAGFTGSLATSAGAGGSPGGSGTAGTGAGGGIAGSAIRRVSAYTLTKIVAGTISGAEVTI